MSKKKNNGKKKSDRNKSLLGKNSIFTPEVIDCLLYTSDAADE